MYQILIVEDDLNLNQGLCKALKTQDRQIVSCSNMRQAYEQLTMGAPNLILLDINLPDGNGLELLKKVKADYPGTFVVMLTANDTDADVVRGLEKGADDYITKPFSLAVLRARVNTQLRRVVEEAESQKQSGQDLFSGAGYSFDFVRMIFTIGDQTVELSKTEQKLLRLLVENQGITLTRDDLIDRIWTDGLEYVDENALSVSVKRLRDKLGNVNRIKTIYGIGYCWEE